MPDEQSFMQSLKETETFISQQNDPPYYLYLNHTNRYVSIHASNSSDIPPNPPTQTTIFEKTENGFWYGPLSSYVDALSFAVTLSDYHHISEGEYLLAIHGRGINYMPRRPR